MFSLEVKDFRFAVSTRGRGSLGRASRRTTAPSPPPLKKNPPLKKGVQPTPIASHKLVTIITNAALHAPLHQGCHLQSSPMQRFTRPFTSAAISLSADSPSSPCCSTATGAAATAMMQQTSSVAKSRTTANFIVQQYSFSGWSVIAEDVYYEMIEIWWTDGVHDRASENEPSAQCAGLINGLLRGLARSVACNIGLPVCLMPFHVT